MTDLHWREQQVLEGLAQGLTAEQLGKDLFIGHRTVKTYLKNLYVSLGARNGPHAVALGFERGLLKVGDQS